MRLLLSPLLFLTLLLTGGQYTPSGALPFPSSTPPAVFQTSQNLTCCLNSASTTFTPHSTSDVLAVYGFGGGTTIPTITGTGGCSGSFTTVVSQSGGGDGSPVSTIWATGVPASTSSCTVTSTVGTGATTFVIVAVYEIQNASTTVDGSPTGTTAFIPLNNEAASYNNPSVTTTVNNDIILTVAASLTAGQTQTIGSGFTVDSASCTYASSSACLSVGHFLKTTAGTVTPAVTQPASGQIAGATLALEP